MIISIPFDIIYILSSPKLSHDNVFLWQVAIRVMGKPWPGPRRAAAAAALDLPLMEHCCVAWVNLIFTLVAVCDCLISLPSVYYTQNLLHYPCSDILCTADSDQMGYLSTVEHRPLTDVLLRSLSSLAATRKGPDPFEYFPVSPLRGGTFLLTCRTIHFSVWQVAFLYASLYSSINYLENSNKN